MAVTTRTLASGIRALTAGSKGSIVICIPGWPQTAEAFLPIFPRISKNHRVFSLDPPGLGESLPPPDNDYTTGAISRIMREAAVATIPDQKFHLVGHDIGAWIAYTWARQFPSNILSLSILDAAVPGLGPKQQFPLPGPMNTKLFQFSFNTLPDLPEILTEGRERKFLDWLFDTKTHDPRSLTEESRELYATAYSQPGAMTRGFGYYRAAASSSEQNIKLLGELGKLEMPTLALSGLHGAGSYLKTSVEGFAQNVSGETIDDCGHYIMEEQPALVAGKMEDFFKAIDAP